MNRDDRDLGNAQRPQGTKGPPMRMEDFAAEVILRVSGLPDRTSPDEYPDMMLVSGEELEDIILGVFDDMGHLSEG